jgi:ribosomal protein S4
MANTVYKNNFFMVFLFLETRLLNLIFRSNLLPNLYFSKQFILHKNIFLNNKLVYDFNIVPRFNELVSLNKKYFNLFYFNYYRLLKKRKTFLNAPSYYEIDYKLFLINIIRYPIFSDLTQSLSFNRYSNFLAFTK